MIAINRLVTKPFTVQTLGMYDLLARHFFSDATGRLFHINMVTLGQAKLHTMTNDELDYFEALEDTFKKHGAFRLEVEL